MPSRKPNAAMNQARKPSARERFLMRLIDEEIASNRVAPPVMPQVGLRVREVTQKSDYSMKELAAEIEREPTLAARVVRHANSSTYAGLVGTRNLYQAVARLGARTVESIAVAAATRDLYQAGSATERKQMELLWKHSVATGETGRIIANEVESRRPEDTFLTCLLHDLGRVVILRALGNIEKDLGSPVSEGLRDEILEARHAEYGSRLLQRWRFPVEICEAVSCHHCPEEASTGSLLPHVVHVADRICHKLGYSDRPDPYLFIPASPSSSFLGFDSLRMSALLARVEEALARTSYLVW